MRMTVDSYQFKSSLLPLLRRLEEAQAGDAVAEKKIRNTGCVAGLLFVSGIGSCIGVAANEMNPGFFVIPALLAVLAIVFLVRMVKLDKYDLDNRKLECAVGLLRMLRADTPVSQEVALDLDLRPYKQKAFLVSGKQGRGEDGRYQQSWLKLAGGLADGTRYQLSVVDSVARKEKLKRKGRVKVKERTIGSVQLQLRLKAGKYGEVEGIAESLRGTPPPAPLKIKEVRLAGPRLIANLTTGAHVKVEYRGASEQGKENTITSDTLLATLLWAYDGLGRTVKAT